MGEGRRGRVRTRRPRGVGVVVFVVVMMMAGFVVQTGVAFGIAVFGVTERQIPSTAGVHGRVSLPGGVRLSTVATFAYRGVHGVYIAPLGSEASRPTAWAFILPEWTVYPPPGSTITHTTRAFGWPLPSWFGAEPRPNGELGATTRSSLLKGFHPSGAHPLPTIPIPLNTLANSAIYGVIVAGVWVIASTARRVWRGRFKPGTCTHCGYALAGLPSAGLCPECGRER